MFLPIALALALMSTPSNETHPICVQRFDAELRPTRAACIEAGGEVASVHARRDDGLVALVTRPDGALEVLTWAAKPGSSPSRHSLASSGEFRGSRLRSDGDIVIALGGDLMRVHPADGRVLARFPFRAARTVEVVSDGAWIFDEGRLTWTGLDGSKRVFPAPSAAPEVPLRFHPPVSRAGRDVDLIGIEGGDLLIVEHVGDSHRLKGRPDEGDVTIRLGLTRIDPGGRVLGQRVYDRTRKYVQWFWNEKDSSNPGPLPTDWGLARSRWSGFVGLTDAKERPDGSIVVSIKEKGEDGRRIISLDRGLRERWNRRFQKDAVLLGPPPWSKGLLFFDAHYRMLALDEAGKGERRAEMPFPGQFSERSYRHAIIGQAPADEWYIAIW